MVINGREYEWADVALIVGGVEITGFQGISYNEQMDKDYVRGKGRYPRAVQRGNYSVSGQLVLLQSEYEKLVASSPSRKILDLTVDAVVSYGGNLENGAGSITNDVIVGMEFTEAPKEINQEDKFMVITIPFIALRIINQI